MSKLVVIPLGTISPYCKGKMNCPGYLITYNDKKILLDCGNGITRLLDFPSDLNNLTVIITHYHKDHFGDLGILQYASYVYHKLELLDDKVKVYLPKDDFQDSKKSIINNKESFTFYEDIDVDNIINIDDLKISFHNNNSHTITSYVVKIENKNLKIVYTSDIGTTNLTPLIEFCRNADLLICESSFVESHHTLSTTHLTTKTASIIAKGAGVKKLLLTHFFPETDKNEYLDEAKVSFKNVDVAKEGKKLIFKR